MDTDPTRSSLSPLPSQAPGLTLGRTATSAPPVAEREKIGELAREFEAYFVFQLVRQMRQSMLEDENGQGLGAGTMTDTLDVELGRQLTNAGGIGLAQILQTAIERQLSGGSPTPSPAGTRAAGFPLATGAASKAQGLPLAPREPEPVHGLLRSDAGASGEAALPLPVTAPLSSSFGWRSDPFDRASRFHAGVDIRAAYGREVPAAGGGQVVFSGASGGYGNTVVIEHAGGVRTRYAHLSSIQVEAGQRVQAGSVIGRVGSSGRSTGPHLHFEVLQNGHPVNPEVAATRYAGQLKLGGVVADSSNSQPSVPGVAAGVDDEDSGQ